MPGVTIRRGEDVWAAAATRAAITARSAQSSARDLAAQDRNLMPQDQDLHVFEASCAEQHQPAEQPDHEEIEEAEEHHRRG